MSFSAYPDPVAADAPIGIFDSGVGALSVLRHIQARLPSEHLLCFADSGHAPYGGKSDAAIIERTLAIAAFLSTRNIKAIVVACNTATAAAIEALRQHYPKLIIVGVEPGLKPAAVFSKSGKAGVLATASTLASSRFIALRDQISTSTGISFLTQACVGLVEQIEKGELDTPETVAMLERYVTPLLQGGADTLALGCTHYPFVQPTIEAIAQRESAVPVTIIDTGEAVSRQLERLLQQRGLQRFETTPGSLQAFTTGSRDALVSAFAHLLNQHPTVTEMPAKTAA
ncbi:glutamate racemase [Herminiimonas sp. KBW02]|uniref:glutamate racemase n=1 Tax=Herminiimonas sp. KBW02 TaxID=2153363 RepID=UPI000F596249|nr:glutamate racemase [Herminiimonas sp. KBW02]RQO35853.1 glutamate racemase [Herminiimonas sp. KBW02]